MKKRIHFLAFLLIFIFMIIPNNVYAESLIPAYAKIDSDFFVNTGMVMDKVYTRNVQCSLGYCSFNVDITVAYEDIQDIKDYPYLLIYVKSDDEDFSISRTSSCNQSCFSNSFQYAKLGRTTWVDPNAGTTNGYLYAIIVPISKYYLYNNWATYNVDDSVKFTTNNNNWHSYQFVNIFVSKDTTILNNSYSTTEQNKNDTQTIINNQNTNTQTIINNQNQNANQQHQDMQELNDTMTSEEAPTTNDVSGKTSEWSSKLAGTGPVSQMVLMPITLLNGYVSGMNATCQPYNLGNLMGTDIVLPCINVSNYLGSTLWNVIDILFSGFMIYAIGKKFVKIFNDFTNLRDNQIDDLYGGGK